MERQIRLKARQKTLTKVKKQAYNHLRLSDTVINKEKKLFDRRALPGETRFLNLISAGAK